MEKKLEETFYIQKDLDNRLIELRRFLSENMPSATFVETRQFYEGNKHYPVTAKIDLLYDIDDVGKLHYGLQKKWHKEGNG